MLSSLDWTKNFESIRKIFSSPCFGPHVKPVSAAWKYLEADFPSGILAAFYTCQCVQVSHQELGTPGTCAWSAAQPSALFLILA